MSDMRANNAELLAEINRSGDLTGEQEQTLVKAMETFKSGFGYR
jgi:F-type H+-transporting ATPase subunit alpha